LQLRTKGNYRSCTYEQVHNRMNSRNGNRIRGVGENAQALMWRDPREFCIVAAGHLKRGEVRQAKHILKKGDRRHPHDPGIAGMRIEIYIRRGDMVKAERAFRRMLKDGTAEEQHYVAMIKGHSKFGKTENVQRILGIAMERGMDGPAIWFAAQGAKLAGQRGATA